MEAGLDFSPRTPTRSLGPAAFPLAPTSRQPPRAPRAPPGTRSGGHLRARRGTWSRKAGGDAPVWGSRVLVAPPVRRPPYPAARRGQRRRAPPREQVARGSRAFQETRLATPPPRAACGEGEAGWPVGAKRDGPGSDWTLRLAQGARDRRSVLPPAPPERRPPPTAPSRTAKQGPPDPELSKDLIPQAAPLRTRANGGFRSPRLRPYSFGASAPSAGRPLPNRLRVGPLRRWRTDPAAPRGALETAR